MSRDASHIVQQRRIDEAVRSRRQQIALLQVEIAKLEEARLMLGQLAEEEARAAGRGFADPLLGSGVEIAVRGLPGPEAPAKKSHHKAGVKRDYVAERARAAQRRLEREQAGKEPPRQRALRSDAGKPGLPIAERTARAAALREKIVKVFEEQPVLQPIEVIEALGLADQSTRHSDRHAVYNALVALKRRGLLQQTQVGEPYTLANGARQP
jgi:hypothetical protein